MPSLVSRPMMPNLLKTEPETIPGAKPNGVVSHLPYSRGLVQPIECMSNWQKQSVPLLVKSSPFLRQLFQPFPVFLWHERPVKEVSGVGRRSITAWRPPESEFPVCLLVRLCGPMISTTNVTRHHNDKRPTQQLCCPVLSPDSR